MTVARQIVFHSVRHADFERQRLKHYQKDLPIIIVLTILFFCSLGAIGSMASSCANPNIGIMT